MMAETLQSRGAGADTGDQANDTLIGSDPQKRAEERKGLCAPWHWFRASPLKRYQFAIFLLFGALTLLWLIIQATSPPTGTIVQGFAAIILAGYGANHFRILLGLKEQVDEFGRHNREFKQENAHLRGEVNKLDKAQAELEGIQNSLQRTNEAYMQNIVKFQELDEKLSKLGDDNIAGIQRLKKMSEQVQESMHKELVQHERNIMMTIQDSMEFKDDKEGLSEAEYNDFLEQLPDGIRKRFEAMDKTFDDMAGDDGLMDYNEFTALCDNFAAIEADYKCHKEH